MSEAKTEAPTAARVRQARAAGDTGASVYASQAVALVAMIALAPSVISRVRSVVENLLRDGFRRAAVADPMTPLDGVSVAKDVALLVAPVLLCVAVAAAAGTLIQTRGLPRGGRSTARRTGRGLPTVGGAAYLAVRSLAAAIVVVWICVHALRARAADLAMTSGRLSFAASAAAKIASSAAWQVASAVLAFAAADVAFARFALARRLRMSRSEVQRERKEHEGDPLAKHAVERARGEEAAHGTVNDVRRASLVVTSSDEVACALRYEAGDKAPVVLATGSGATARALVARAYALGVPVRESDAAKALASIRAGDPIPESQYDAVALLFRSILEPR